VDQWRTDLAAEVREVGVVLGGEWFVALRAQLIVELVRDVLLRKGWIFNSRVVPVQRRTGRQG